MPQLDSPITGIDAGFRTPGNWVEAIFAQGPSVAGGGKREVVFVMPKTSAGTWVANTTYRVTNEQQAIDGAGSGSPLHRAIRRFFSVCKDATVWATPIAATSGGSPVVATSSVTIATTPTAAGIVSVWVCGELCQYSYTTSDTVTTIAAGLVTAINAKTWLPVTAGNVAGVITLTGKIAGISSGTASVQSIRVRVDITPGTATTVATSGDLGSVVAGAEGTTTEAANLATALATLAASRKYYIGTSALDSTSWANVKTHIATKSLPKNGLRSVGIVGYTGSIGTAQTLAIALNYERLQIVWQPKSDHDVPELVAGQIAVRMVGTSQVGGGVSGEIDDPATNLGLVSTNGVFLPAGVVSDWPNATDIENALRDGITPIQSNDYGTVMVQSVTTRSKNSAGTSNDWRASRTSKVSVTDAFLDDLQAQFSVKFGQKKLLRDELLADGKVNPNQRQIRNTVRPSYVVGTVLALIDNYYSAGMLDDVTKIKNSVNVAASDAAPGRIECRLDLRVIDWLDQTTTRLAEVTPG